MPYAPDTGAIATPIGTVLVEADGGGIVAVRLRADVCAKVADSDLVARALDQLADYFAGRRTRFDLPLAAAVTARGAVLRAGMIGIGFGETRRYGELAAELGSSARAIGQACARNPLPILVPCHRVLAATGVGQYSAGDGVRTKRWLLEFERAHRGSGEWLL